MSQAVMNQIRCQSAIYQELTPELQAEIVRRILAAGSPLKIVLFGSRSRGDHTPDSDLDLLVLEANEQVSSEKLADYRKVLEGLFPEISLLVYSLSALEEWRYVPNHVLTLALREGRTVYQSPQFPEDDVEQLDGSLLVAERRSRKTVSDLARGWFRKADNDLRICRLHLDDEQGCEAVCFHAQQAVEKYLKGFLVLHLRPFKKTHDLETLARMCGDVRAMPELRALSLSELTEFADDSRYDLDFAPSAQTVEDVVSLAQQVRDIILAQVPQKAKPH